MCAFSSLPPSVRIAFLRTGLAIDLNFMLAHVVRDVCDVDSNAVFGKTLIHCFVLSSVAAAIERTCLQAFSNEFSIMSKVVNAYIYDRTKKCWYSLSARISI